MNVNYLVFVSKRTHYKCVCHFFPHGFAQEDFIQSDTLSLSFLHNGIALLPVNAVQLILRFSERLQTTLIHNTLIFKSVPIQ